MLKKAKSFREKFKRGTLGRSSTRMEALRAQRGSPLSNQSFESRQLPEPPKNPNVIKVEDKKKKVQQVLLFIKSAIEKQNMIMLPGSATIALETTLELITLITTILSSQETCTKMSELLKNVYDSLSKLIQWADQIMLMDANSEVDAPQAKLVIEGIEKSLEALGEYASEKVAELKMSAPAPEYSTMTLPTKPRHKHRSSADRAKRNSLPEVPMSPREKTILRETSLGAFDNPLAADHKAEPVLKEVTIVQDEPPPKPHLPADFDLRKYLSHIEFADEPPVLPLKQSELSSHDTDGVAPFPVSTTHPDDLSPIQPISVHGVSYTDSPLNGFNNNQNNSHHLRQIHSFDEPDNIHYLSKRMDRLQSDLSSSTDSGLPPPLPGKQRERLGSDYDNINSSDDCFSKAPLPPENIMAASDSWASGVTMRSVSGRAYGGLAPVNEWHRQQMSGHFFAGNMSAGPASPNKRNTVSSIGTMSMSTMSSSDSSQPLYPPPLPPKKKHVESYMHVFGGGEPKLSEFNPAANIQSRQFYLHVQEQHQWELFPTHSMMTNSMMTNSMISTASTPTGDNEQDMFPPQQHVPTTPTITISTDQHGMIMPTDNSDDESDFGVINPLDDIDVCDQLITNEKDNSKKNGKNVHNVKGGGVDALIVYATHVGKHEFHSASVISLVHMVDDDSDFMYQEAFLTTYRTFVSPAELVNKLLYRYNRFAHDKDNAKKKLSRNAFSLLVRVVDELTTSEMTKDTTEILLELVRKLVGEGELILSKFLRKKVLEKCDPNQRPVVEIQIVVPKSPTLTITLIDLKSQDVAEQMTLLDNDLYQTLELPELLIWSEEQDEERCPNLVTFTEHFNKMSWWCRYLILRQDDPLVREKYYLKFTNILKHLRKHNNFNSLLALLSALDSAPVCRLDWPKHATDVVNDFRELINSSSSFKSYRMALGMAEPPCIPYIGMILMDMTFIRIGNSPKLPDGNINFQMRWHLFNVLECLRRFRKPAYTFKKDQKIIQFLDNFNDHKSSDDEMWERSKVLKPSNTK